MNHDEVHALASEYVLGLADEVTRARVAAHLASCPACVDEVRQVAQAMDALGRSVPDEHLSVSDLILPDSDSSLAEVTALLGEDGLIPG